MLRTAKERSVSKLILVLALFLAWSTPAQAQAECSTQPDGSTLCCYEQPDGEVFCTSSISDQPYRVYLPLVEVPSE